MEHVVSIDPTGRVKAMHTDAFPLGFLGKQNIERASDIRWDEDAQYWSIWFNIDGRFEAPPIEYQGFGSYEEARRFEVEVMNSSFLADLAPLDPHILRWAATHRR